MRSQRHVELLRAARIRCGDDADVLDDVDEPDTFVFLDPPYTRVMKSYTAGEVFDDAQQRALAARLAALRHASWMVVINRSDLTEELYGGYVVHRYPVSYGANICNRFD